MPKQSTPSPYYCHVLWLGSSRFSHGDGLFLWVENGTSKPRSTSLSNTVDKRHPCALPWTRYDQLWETISGHHPMNAVRHTEKLLLPTMDGRVLSSDECSDRGIDLDGAPITLKAWDVPGYLIDLDSAVQVIKQLKAYTSDPRKTVPVYMGSTTSFLLKIIQLAMLMIRQQAIAPNINIIDGQAGRRLTAQWVPLLHGQLGNTLTILESAAPGLLRKACSERRVVRDFLNMFIAVMVPRFLYEGQDHYLSGALAYTHYGMVMNLLAHPGISDYPVWHSGLEERLKPLIDWTELVCNSGNTPLTLCFRLEAQSDDDEVSTAASEDVTIPSTWRLAVFVQSLEDPSLMIPIVDFMKGPEEYIPELGTNSRPEDVVTKMLNKAASICRPVAVAVLSGLLGDVVIPSEGVPEFVSETAPRLREEGFTVLLPVLGQLSARANVRTRKTEEPESKGLSKGWFGREGLATYDWEIALGDTTLSRDELMHIARLKSDIVKLRGQWVQINPTQIEAALSLVNGTIKRSSPSDALRVALLGDDMTTDDSGLVIETPFIDEWLHSVVEKLRHHTVQEISPSLPGLNGSLRDYQRVAVGWLGMMREVGLGACLADDMGLGKTIELIGHVLNQKDKSTITGPILLICPTSVVGNWERELEKFAPSLKVLVHHGYNRELGEAFTSKAATSDVVISTYSLVYRDQEDLSSVDWDTVVLDEAQNIKNPSSKQAQAARSIKAGHHIAMTGTPVENHLQELWSIFGFLNPGYLGSADSFRQEFETPIEKNNDEMAANKLRSLVGPLILRRVKTDPTVIRDLPEKQEAKVFCNLTKEQASLYQAILDDMLEKIDKASALERRGLILATLTMLKQVCNHPSHFLKDGLQSRLGARSGKLERLVELLEEVLEDGERALIFTQYREMGDLLKSHLEATFGLDVPFLHGGTPKQARDLLVTNFQEEQVPIFLLSLKAGGIGLNLTAANHVFHFDRWWNPAVEDQATDRAYRIGQRRNVMVHKFVCAGTLEERIDMMLEDKRALAGQVVTSAEGILTELPTRRLAEVLALRVADIGDY